MQAEIMKIGTDGVAALTKWQIAYSAIQGAGVKGELPNARTPGVSIEDVNVLTSLSLAPFAKLRDANTGQLALIFPRLPALKAAIDAIAAQAQQIDEALSAWHGASAVDQSGHLNLQLSHPEKGSFNYDLGVPLAIIVQHAATLIDAFPNLSHASGNKSASVFEGLTRAALTHLGDAKSSAKGARAELKSGTNAVKELTELTQKASLLSKQIEEMVSEVANTKGSTEQNAAEVLSKLAQIREVSKDADALQQRVTSFTAQFEAFEAQMKARLELFAQFEAETKEAQRINKEREEKITELTNKADAMIRGATTAGLSKSLDETKDEYERRLSRTQWFFLGSVAFLLVSALPIAAQLIPGPWQGYFSQVASGGASGAGPWLSAIGKLILVLPGTWATAFFAANYAELFHLSREYAHKAALAKAIDGFQREAPEYKQEIVGSVFMEIQDNPGSRRAPRPATPQNPITKKFLEKVLDAIKAVKSSP